MGLLVVLDELGVHGGGRALLKNVPELNWVFLVHLDSDFLDTCHRQLGGLPEGCNVPEEVFTNVESNKREERSCL